MQPEKTFSKDTFKEYLEKKEYISSSGIKNFLKSPKFYYYEKYEKTEKDDGRHFAIGSALHELIMEPELFNSNYIVTQKFDRRTKVGKQEYNDFLEKNKNKTLINEDEMDMMNKMINNVVSNETFMSLLKDSHREMSVYVTDNETGLKLKMRPDILCINKSTIVDIKSCIDSTPKSFKSSVYNYGYNISAAFYMDYVGKENYVFAAIEKQQPYQMGLYTLNDDMIEFGRSQYKMALKLMKWSYENNYWCDHNEFEILKECYQLGNLDKFFDINKNSIKITVL